MLDLIKKFFTLLIALLLVGCLIWLVPQSSKGIPQAEANQSKKQPQINPQVAIINKLETIHSSLDHLLSQPNAVITQQQKILKNLINDLQSSELSCLTKITNLKNLLQSYLIDWSATDKQELNAWLKKWQESSAQNSDWFTPRKWLTDAEIDWALGQLPPNNKFKILPAYQFNYVQECQGTSEADAHLALPGLIKDIDDLRQELVFIPVNQPNFHWSLLVYETKNKLFYHYDTLRGANWDYLQPLCEQLLTRLHKNNNLKLTNYLFPRHDIYQGNGWDCGIAVISLIKRISEQYQGAMSNLKLEQFDFAKEREELRKLYSKEDK